MNPAVRQIVLMRRAAAAVAGAALVAVPTAATIRYHPTYSTVATSGGRVTSISDLSGNGYDAVEGSAGIGPRLMTDAYGRNFLRFDGSQYLNIPTTPTMDPRNFAFFMVGRYHRSPSGGIGTLFSINTGTNPGRAQVVVGNGTTNAAPYLAGGSISATTTTNSNSKNGIVGQQLQVISVVSRTTANGGQRLYINNEVNTVAQNGGGTAGIGAQVGRFVLTPGTSGNWGQFDLYDLILVNSNMTNSQADAQVAALTAAWGLTTTPVNNLILSGDSITQGVIDVLPSDNIGMVLSEPGGAYAVDSTWRVTTTGVSGYQIPNLVAQRDTTASMFQSGAMLSGRNVIQLMIGINDLGAAGNTNYPGSTFNTSNRATDVYNAKVALLNTPTTGYLQHGFEVHAAINPGCSVLQTGVDALRVLDRSSQFPTDTLTGSGQTYAGKLVRMEIPLISYNGATIFDTAANSLDTTYYQADHIHPSVVGERLLAGLGYKPAL